VVAGLSERSMPLAAEPVSAREARRFVRSLLSDSGHEEWLEAAELAVSEIVTNAVLHAHSAMTLTVRVLADVMRVEVRDHDPALPSARHYDEQATTGRGMTLLAAVTGSHGVTALGGEGKIVWFTLGDGVASLPPVGMPEPGEGVGRPRPQETLTAVVLLAMPPTLWFAARQHHEALLREVALHHVGIGAPDDDLALADTARRSISGALEQAVEQARRTGSARSPLPPGHPAHLADVPPTVDLVLSLPAGQAHAFEVLQDVLDAAERLAAQDALLARPGLPEVVAIRDWACEQVIAQLAGMAPSPWVGTDAERFTTLVSATEVELGWDPSAVRDSDAGAVAADDANRIVAVSRPLADALGWEVADLVGRRVVALVPHRFREAHVAGFTRHLTTGEAHVIGVSLELPVLRRDGSEVVCSFLIESTRTATGRTAYTAWITPLPAEGAQG
jgi:PAS domain S-box-containing protein